MRQHLYPKRRFALYLIPIVIGLGGVVFSQQLGSLLFRSIVLALSITVPLFASVNLLARYHSSRLERAVLLAGVLFLILGGGFSVSDLSSTLDEQPFLPEALSQALHYLGIVSLLLGLFVVLFMVVRTGEDIEEIGERFRHLAEHISEGFILSAADGTVILVNNQFLEMLDLPREQILGHTTKELAKKMNLAPVHEQIQNRAKGLASEYEVSRTVRGEERRFWFNGKPIFDAQGRHTATLATVRDITEHHRLSQRVERYAQGLQRLVEEQTQKLIRSEERFRQLLVSMNEGFLTIDAANRIRFANERICAMLWMNPADLLGRDVFDFVDSLGRMRLLNLLTQGAAVSSSECRQELDFVTSTGEHVPAVVAVAHIPDAEAREPAFSLVITSVAEQKEMQQQLEQRARELERANAELRSHDRAKDSFLSNVSHELRTPLSTIQGYVEMLASDNLGALSGPQQGALTVMARNVERLVGLINEMIEFSRMEIRGVQINVDLFPPALLLREAAGSIHPHTLARDISVNTFIADGFPYAWGDRQKLSQVLGILLSNAVKFTEPAGLIQIRADIRPERTLAIAVSDTGIGIAPEYHEKIFSKFYQVDSSKTRRYEGAGIGLSIARSIVEAHNGTIELQSALGKGSTFTVVLPDALFDTGVNMPDAADLNGLHLLFIDESGDYHNALQAILASAGCRTTHVPNAYEGIRAAEQTVPDIVLINESPSDVAGANSLRLLRSQSATETVPAIVLSSEGPTRIHDMTGLWSSTFLLSKPFKVLALLSSIRAAHSGELWPGSGQKKEETERDDRDTAGTTDIAYVLFIDSDPGLLEWAETALTRRQIPCFCTSTADKAVTIAEKEPPVVIFVDVDGPGMCAAEQVGVLFREHTNSHPPIYIMTGLPGDVETPNGIAGVLRKPFDVNEIVNIVCREQNRRAKRQNRIY